MLSVVGVLWLDCNDANFFFIRKVIVLTNFVFSSMNIVHGSYNIFILLTTVLRLPFVDLFFVVKISI